MPGQAEPLTTHLFEAAGGTRFGAERVIGWTAEHLGDIRRWLDDRGLRAPSELLYAYQLLRHGLTDEAAIRAETSPEAADGAHAIRDRLTGDVLGHPNAHAMVADRAPLRLVQLGPLLCPVYVDRHRELLLPRWLSTQAMVTLFPPNDHFTLGRGTSTVWVVLEAPVADGPGTSFVKFASLFAPAQTGAGARWHWRGRPSGHAAHGPKRDMTTHANNEGRCADAAPAARDSRPHGSRP